MAATKPNITPGVNPLSSYLEDEFDESVESNEPEYYIEKTHARAMPLGGLGASQKTLVVMKDPNFTTRFFMQWIDEERQQEYDQQGFQFVKPEWVLSSWASTVTGTDNQMSDKLRIYVGIGEHGLARYNVLVFIPMKFYTEYLLKMHKQSTMNYERAESELQNAQTAAMGGKR